MFKRFPFLSPAALSGLCFAPPDGGAGGGPAAASGAADPAVAAAADPNADPNAAGDPADSGGGDPARAATATGDDDDNFDDDGADVADHLPEPQVRTRTRKLQRIVARTRPIAERFRDPRTGKLMSVEQVDRILARAREFDPIDEVLGQSPAAVEFLMKEQQRLQTARAGGSAAAAVEEEDAPFDPSTWPFETDTPEGKALLGLAQANHSQASTIKKLEKRLNGVSEKDSLREFSTVNQTWKAATLTAAKELDEHYRPLFIRSVNRLFKELHNSGQLARTDVNAAIASELADIRAANKKANRQTATSQSATAAANANLPRVPRPGAVVPASTSGNKPRETMKDASTGFLGKYAGGTRR